MGQESTLFSDALTGLHQIDADRSDEHNTVKRESEKITPGAVAYSKYASYRYESAQTSGTFQANVKDQLEDLFKLSGRTWTIVELFASARTGIYEGSVAIYGWASVRDKTGAIIEIKPESGIFIEKITRPIGHGIALLTFMGRLNASEEWRIKLYNELLKVCKK